MKKLLSLMLVLCLLPMFSLAEHSIAANYIYQMILKQVDGTDFTRYDDDYEVMFFYPLSKHTYGDAVVRITAYEDGCTINVSYELPIDEAMMPDVLTFFNYLNNSLYVGKMMLLDIDGDWYPAYEVFMSINPEDIDAWDRGCVMDYTFNAFYVMQEMTDYLPELEKGETPCGCRTFGANDRKNPLHVALTHAIMEETWRISPEMRAFLMKKLFSLLLVLALALMPTLSLADDDAACQNLYNMLLDELKSVDLEMTADEESYRIYLGYALDKNSLGDADVIFDAYSDAVTINVSYSNPLDEALVPQVISFFNRVNSTLYVGKLMVIKSDNVWYAAYEIFLSVNPENITDWDRNNVLAYTALALDTMEAMEDYITEIANGESADNVFAMWQADIGAV